MGLPYRSLTGWWIRSQSSFHGGEGIKFYDPSAGETVAHRFTDSKGVDVWTKGEVTLLKDVATGHVTSYPVESNGRAFQQLRSIKWGTTNGVLLHDGYDVDKIDTAGAETHFIDFNAGSDDKVYAICDDGTSAYWVTNAAINGDITYADGRKTVTRNILIKAYTSSLEVHNRRWEYLTLPLDERFKLMQDYIKEMHL